MDRQRQRQGYLEEALKYAERKMTISRNGLRVRPQMRGRPIPHYQYPRNNQIYLEVQHRPAIIHPRNMMYANIHRVNGVHYQPQKPHMRTQDTARFCNSLGYFLPAPKLLTRDAKIASNNKQRLEAVKEKSRTSSQRTSPKVPSNSPSAPSATTKRKSKTSNTPPRNTPKVLQGTTRVMRISRRRSNV
jgi:hypothetical protein